MVLYRFVQHDPQDGSPFHPNFLGHDDSGLHIFDDRIHSETISWQVTFGNCFYEVYF